MEYSEAERERLRLALAEAQREGERLRRLQLEELPLMVAEKNPPGKKVIRVLSLVSVPSADPYSEAERERLRLALAEAQKEGERLKLTEEVPVSREPRDCEKKPLDDESSPKTLVVSRTSSFDDDVADDDRERKEEDDLESAPSYEELMGRAAFDLLRCRRGIGSPKKTQQRAVVSPNGSPEEEDDDDDDLAKDAAKFTVASIRNAAKAAPIANFKTERSKRLEDIIHNANKLRQAQVQSAPVSTQQNLAATRAKEIMATMRREAEAYAQQRKHERDNKLLAKLPKA